jgi:hypothetical protein
MAKYGSNEIKLEVDDGTIASPGSYVEVSTDMIDIPAIDKEMLTEEGHGFCEDWVRNLATGLNRANDITVKGFYDDETDGTHELFNRVGIATNIQISWNITGTPKTTIIPVLIKNYRRIPARGELTKFEAVLITAGEPTDG